MQYRLDPKSGNRLSVLGFGCMRFPGGFGRTDFDKTEKLLMEAYHKGINYFDTAYLYQGSEEILGKIVKKHNIRNKIYIATKLPQSSCKSFEDFDRYYEIHKKRLQTDYIDYYLMHNISTFSQWERLCAMGIEKWIKDKKEKGEIRQIGFSFHGPESDFPKMLEAYHWDFCQIQYNYINTNYQAGEKGLKLASEKGLPVMIMEPLLGGKLVNGLPKEALEIFKKSDKNTTPASWALNWLWNQPEVTVVLSGMNEPSQLEENIALADKAVPNMLKEGELQTIGEVVSAFNKSYKIPCTGCNYCMPCPKGINIPACFASYNTSYAISYISGIQQYVLSCAGLTTSPHFASDCIECGKCEKHCPQNIPIKNSLKDVRKRLQPFVLPPALSFAARFLR